MTSAEPIAGAGSREDLEEALINVAAALNRGTDRREVLEQIAVELQRLVPHTELLIGLVDEADRVVVPVFTQGPYADLKLAMRIPYGEGLSGRVAETGKPVVYNQAASDDPTLKPRRVGDYDDLVDEYVLAVPLVGPHALEGILVLYRQGPGQARWKPDDLRVVELFAANAQVALHNADVHAAADKRAKRLAAMNEVLRCTPQGVEEADVQTICASWEHALRDLIPFTISGIALERPAGNSGECLAVWLTGSIASVVTAPLMARGEAFGVIGLGHAEPGMYDHDTLDLLEEVAVYLSAAIDNVLLYKEVFDHRENQTRLLAKVLTAREEERKKLATELHDDTIQVLAAALLHADRVAETDPERNPELHAKLRATLESAMAKARQTMLNLRPPLLDERGLQPALRQQLDALEEDGISTRLVWELQGRLDEPVETLLFRTLQEALRNVRKHARATRVEVEVRGCPTEGLVVGVVRDNGVGFEVSDVLQQAMRGGHLGLHSMLEQAATAGGDVKIDATPDEGTELRVAIPRKIGVSE